MGWVTSNMQIEIVINCYVHMQANVELLPCKTMKIGWSSMEILLKKFIWDKTKKVASEHTRIKSIEWGCDWKGEKLQEKWSTKCSYNSKENVLICRDRHQTLCPNCSNIIA